MDTNHVYAEGAGSGGGGTAGSRASGGRRSMADRARQAVTSMMNRFAGRSSRSRTRRNR